VPRFNGTFDPERFNAMMLAPLLPRDGTRRTMTAQQFIDLPEDARQILIDTAESILNELWNMGILR
jgi:hypothetical protein